MDRSTFLTRFLSLFLSLSVIDVGADAIGWSYLELELNVIDVLQLVIAALAVPAVLLVGIFIFFAFWYWHRWGVWFGYEMATSPILNQFNCGVVQDEPEPDPSEARYLTPSAVLGLPRLPPEEVEAKADRPLVLLPFVTAISAAPSLVSISFLQVVTPLSLWVSLVVVNAPLVLAILQVKSIPRQIVRLAGEADDAEMKAAGEIPHWYPPGPMP